jgi:hypothetical protein
MRWIEESFVRTAHQITGQKTDMHMLNYMYGCWIAHQNIDHVVVGSFIYK